MLEEEAKQDEEFDEESRRRINGSLIVRVDTNLNYKRRNTLIGLRSFVICFRVAAAATAAVAVAVVVAAATAAATRTTAFNSFVLAV
ncbi:hypothetical protein V1477_007732 [Vespula maculifrons]|uniref:Uncharacterized protein n=1 Tax=Vespula maculifrons TaxID=7453 RepID=A0ABD2CFL0_VESMC